ncbi:hypothetical protein ACFY2T_36215 [Streptomyces sp. NPDC001260]|uniref:hypothetical protein n=1 Tax=Streptomyces sp. NPDC001260 TaxID=3364551 RepID=UPI0036BF58A5
MGDLLGGTLELEDPGHAREVAFRLADLQRDPQSTAAMRFAGPLGRRYWWDWDWVEAPYNGTWLPQGTSRLFWPFLSLSEVIRILTALLYAAADADFTASGDVTPDPRIVVPLAS